MERQSMDKVTQIMNEADILFGLRPALEKFGFAKDKNIYVSFKYEDRKYKTGAIPPSDYERTSSLSTQNMNSAVLDCMNKAEIQLSLGQALSQELNLKDDADLPITITIISEDTNKFVLTWPIYCVPCFRGAGFNCWK